MTLEARALLAVSRAMDEMDGWTWWHDPDAGFWWLETTAFQVYEVGLGGECCSCWQWVRYAYCKHVAGTQMRFGQEDGE